MCIDVLVLVLLMNFTYSTGVFSRVKQAHPIPCTVPRVQIRPRSKPLYSSSTARFSIDVLAVIERSNFIFCAWSTLSVTLSSTYAAIPFIKLRISNRITIIVGCVVLGEHLQVL